LLAAAGIDHQFHGVAHGFAGRLDQKLVECPIAAPEGTPAELDGPEPAPDDGLERPA
jgi:hypothetical protein